MSDTPVRNEFEFSLETAELGKRKVKVVDRLMVDDIVRFMIEMEIFRVITGTDEYEETPIPEEHKSYLISDQYLVRLTRG